MLLRMTLFAGKGKKSFPAVLNSLFVDYLSASVSAAEIIKNRKSNYPHIATLKNSKDTESRPQYAVYFEGNVLNLPMGSSMEHALDILFKIIWIFHYEYDPTLAPFFSCLEYLVYEINEYVNDSAKETVTLIEKELNESTSSSL